MKLSLWTAYRAQVLWCFISFAFGTAFYFSLPFEPSLWPCIFVTIVCLALFIWRRYFLIKLLLFFCLGVSITTIRTHFIHTTFLPFPLKNQQISGTIDQSFFTKTGQTIVVNNPTINGIPFINKKIRLSFDQSTPSLQVGDSIHFVSTIYAPRPNQARRFFYQGITAQGKIKKLLEHTPGNHPFLDNFRAQIISRLQTHLSDKQAQIAIPLVVGEQQVVSSELYDIYRKAGIAHVLSVSGFHMALLAGFVFFLIRGLLALLPSSEKFYLSSKKIAAVVAFCVTGLYLLISGQQVPAIRSFLMISLVFLGILTDRKTFSLYTLLLVGFCLLLFRPEWITSVSFQFSFIAVMILVGLFEDLTHKTSKIHFGRIIYTALTANILITLALAPFVIYHFNQFNPYGVLGNLATSILFSIWVMPMLFIGTMAIPFHLEGVFFKAAGFALEFITDIAQSIAEWPYSEIIVPTFSGFGLMIISFGLCMLCLIKNKYRLCGLLIILLGFILGYLTINQPDLIVADKGRVILARNTDRTVSIKGNPKSWMAKQLLKQNGQSDAPPITTDHIDIKGYKIALEASACPEADLAILKKQTPNCTAKDIFIPRRYIKYNIFLKKPIEIHSEDRLMANRPWRIKQKSQTNRKDKNE